MKKLLMLAVALMFPAFAAVAESGKLTDAEIAHVVVTANTIDIENGELAKKKASNDAVREFAARMINEHTDLNQQASALANKLNVKPQDNALSKSLREDANKTQEKLKDKSGKEFDKAYIDAEIKFHKQVIEAADKKLVPSVQNDELKAMLVGVRPLLVSHREHAERIEGKLD